MNKSAIQTEVDASYLYKKLAAVEQDPALAQIFQQMSAIEHGHAIAYLRKLGLPESAMPRESGRARTLNRIGKLLGYDYVLGTLMDTEKSISNAVLVNKRKNGEAVTGTEINHVRILKALTENSGGLSGTSMARLESRHRSVGGNALRAAVLGGNDGLVSNFSLVMGVAGATAGGSGVLLSGVAGLLAGALSMSLGEWISVRSSQELYENQIKLEQEEIDANPEGEEHELALIYMAKGVSEAQAREMAAGIMKDKDKAHEVLVQEELGINQEELKGSAMEAAIYSFVLFSIGAVIPVAPFFFLHGYVGILVSVAASAVGLFLIGAAITLFTGKSIWYSGLRQVIFGLAAAAITFGIGKLIGVSLAG